VSFSTAPGTSPTNMATALNEFRSLDYDNIPFQDLARFVVSTIDLIDLLVETGFSDHGAERAARRFLTTLSEKDYGSATETDVEQWRTWYDEWHPAALAERNASGN